MVLLYSTGLRLSESLGLKLTDIDGERLQIRVVKGKGAKDRYVEMPACLLGLLREYYRAYRPKHLLFNGKRVGQPWAQRSAQWAIKNARSAAGIERAVSPHVFRHCYATHHLENGTNLVYLKEQLGHKHRSAELTPKPQNHREVHPPMQGLSKTSAASNCGHGNHLPDGHTIGQLFRDYGEEYIRVYGASRQTIKLIRSIRASAVSSAERCAARRH